MTVEDLLPGTPSVITSSQLQPFRALHALGRERKPSLAGESDDDMVQGTGSALLQTFCLPKAPENI